MPFRLRARPHSSLLMAGLLATGCSGLSSSPTGDSDAPDPRTNTSVQRILPGPVCTTIQRGVKGDIHDTQLADTEDRNYGGGLYLNVGKVGAGHRATLYGVDTGPLPSMLELVSATLVVRVRSGFAGTIDAHEVHVPWTEDTATWAGFFGNPAPQYGPEVIESSPVSATTHQISFDITGYAFAVASGVRPNYGILLTQNGNGFSDFYSSEDADPSQHPKLQLCYIPDLCAGVSCPPTDACHAAGACDPMSGQCSNPLAPDGTGCDDGSAQTSGDACTAGVCAGTSPGGYVYPLFAGGPGFACPGGSTVWVGPTPRDPQSSDDAKRACEACYGVGQCYLSGEELGGWAWGPISATPPYCGAAYFGFTAGVTGDDGRSWRMCGSTTTFGHWGK